MKKKNTGINLTEDDVFAIESEIGFMTNHISKCRKNHSKMSLEFIKWHTKNLYEWIVQIEMLHRGKIPRAGIDTPNWQEPGKCGTNDFCLCPVPHCGIIKA